MPSWNDFHYARATEFARLIADATATGRPQASPPTPASPPAKEATAAPTPKQPAPPAVTPVATPAVPASPPAGPTAGSLFNKMPWKK
jgi:hypothetical protein